MMRMIFSTVRAPQEPALTVESFPIPRAGGRRGGGGEEAAAGGERTGAPVC